MKFLLILTLICMNFMPQTNALPSLSAPAEVEAQHQNFSFLQPLKKQLVQWNILINREIPKRMKALKDNPTPTVILLSILSALAYGILHTLGPGHGKMVVATYFLTHGAQFWRGVFVGIQVAFSHVAGAVFLVFATDIVMRQLFSDPEAQVFWVRAISYSLIILIGVYMLVKAGRHAIGKGAGHTCGHCSHHAHEHRTKEETILSWCVGAIPCTGSLLILLYAMAHDMLWLGLIMVFFIAVGMAFTMTLIGWLCILGKQKFIDTYLNKTSSSHLWKIALEALGALLIILVGTLFLLTLLT